METYSEKYCPQCDTVKPADQFGKDKTPGRGGLTPYCKKCRQKIGQENQKKPWYKETVKKAMETRKQKREKVIDHYSGGKMCCCKCGFSDYRALSIDHTNGDGSAHRKVLAGMNICDWIVKNDFPPMFQILCMNCQLVKRYDNQEYNPHGKKGKNPPQD